ncbi:glycosyltransferase family 4 protein [Streptomyces sp. N2-109]|uniref:D-inositol 3-phosphate glycosyltransferase n=1 Tax=Streptomyces gossypii TaxID=2883101 RepID=A0ABT2K367_9ACTN|nr:glycosyltransferase family 4 protein [Streptomyces gossypii]MCT2594614.1 glycosyltransferase family 4 protein [Streptomyces gossypii]
MRIRYLLLHAYGRGGTIRTVFNQANHMAAAGHDVEIVSVERRREEPQFGLDDRVRITTLIDLRQGAAPETGRGPLARYRASRRAVDVEEGPRHIPPGEFLNDRFNRHVEKTVIGYLRTVRGGVLVSTRPGLNILVSLHAPRGVVLVAQDHMNLGVYTKDVQRAIRSHYRRFHAVAVLTHADREDYEALLPGTRIVRIPNAVHSMEQQPADYGSRVAVAAGRLFPQKAFDKLVLAFAQVVERHPDWQLRIFGTGELKDELRALIEEHHLYNHVFLMGHTSELDDELARGSLYVLSSRFEGLPMVMIEAMTHGLPVVSFDCPTGPAEVITDGKEGLLVPPRQVEGLADAMAQLMDDEGLRADMGAAALATSHSYAPEVVHPQWEALFEELLTGDAG